MANLRVNEITTGVGSYNGSIYATGTSSYLFTTVTAPGTDDFTIECYINTDAASNGTQDGIFAINASTSGFQSNTNNQIRFTLGRAGGSGQDGGLEVNINGTAVDCGNNDIIQEGTWHHVAVTRASGTVKIWVDGVEKASGSAAGDVTGTTFVTGYYDGNYTYQGFLSNFRYRKGTAHYTTTFTAPTKPLERTSDTELIFAQSPHNAGNGFSSAIHGGTTDIMQVNGNVTANESSPTQLSDTSAVGVVYDGTIKHNTQGYMYFPTGRREERGRGRAIFMGGSIHPVSPSYTANIDYVEMTTSGVGVRFGSLTTVNTASAAFASSTRGINAGGQPSSPDGQTNILEFVTIATEGDGTDFGDLDTAHRRLGGQGHSSQTRGIIAGGGGDSPAQTNVIQFVTIASIGNATDFGDLLNPKDTSMAKNGSSTRMLICGGQDYTPSAANTNVVEFITIATTGNSQNFGDLTSARSGGTGCSSATRGVIVGGRTPTVLNTIDFVTIASAGDATDFGDLTAVNAFLGGANNSIKGIFAGGSTPTKLSTIQTINIATTGDAVAYGDNKVTDPVTGRGTCSDSHGGLS